MNFNDVGLSVWGRLCGRWRHCAGHCYPPLTVMDSGVKGGSHHEKRMERVYMYLEIMRSREQVLVVKVNVHRATTITLVITAQTLPYPHGLTGGSPEQDFRNLMP